MSCCCAIGTWSASTCTHLPSRCIHRVCVLGADSMARSSGESFLALSLSVGVGVVSISGSSSIFAG